MPDLDDLLNDEALQGAPLSIADPWASADPWANLSAPLPAAMPAPPAAPRAPPALPPLGVQQAGTPAAPNPFAAQLQQQGQPIFMPQGQPGALGRSAAADAVPRFSGQLAAPPAAAAAAPAAPLAALQAIVKPGQLSKRSESARALLTAALSARLRRMQQQQAAVAAARATAAARPASTAPPPTIPAAAVVAPITPAAAAVTRPQAAGPVFSGPLSGEAQLVTGQQPSGSAVHQQAPAGQLLVRDPSSLQPVKRGGPSLCGSEWVWVLGWRALLAVAHSAKPCLCALASSPLSNNLRHPALCPVAGTLRPARPAFDVAALRLSAAAPLVAAGRAPITPAPADLSLLRCVFGSTLPSSWR